MNEVNMIFGTMSKSSFIRLTYTAGFLLISLLIDAYYIHERKHFLKREKSIDQRLKFSRKQLEKEKEKLNILIQKQEKVKKDTIIKYSILNSSKKFICFKISIIFTYWKRVNIRNRKTKSRI